MLITYTSNISFFYKYKKIRCLQIFSDVILKSIQFLLTGTLLEMSPTKQKTFIKGEIL